MTRIPESLRLNEEFLYNKGRDYKEYIKYTLLDKITNKLVVKGTEFIPPAGESAFVVFTPHAGWAEMLLLERALEESGRDDFWVMTKQSIFETPQRYITPDNYFGYRVGTADRKALRKANHLLNQGELVVTALEGTRGRGDTRPLQEAKAGPVYMALKANAPILVAVSLGAEHLAPVPEDTIQKLSFLGPLAYATPFVEAERLRLVRNKPELSVKFTALYEDHLHDQRLGSRQRGSIHQKHAHQIILKHVIPHLPEGYPLGFYENKTPETYLEELEKVRDQIT